MTIKPAMSMKNTPSFPNTRMRRNRAQGWIRDLVRENTLSTHDLIMPIFVIEGEDKEEPISSLPGVSRRSIDLAIEHCREIYEIGIPAIAIFPVIDNALKTEDGAESFNPDNLMCRAIRAIKDTVPDLGIIGDVALDPYTSHGHDGLMDGDEIKNDASIVVLCKQALAMAEAGVDIIAPSDMMDGRVGALRISLDSHNFKNTLIMAYSAKYASSFYGPFRDAVNSGDFLKGDKKTYQMDPANADEAIQEIIMDINEGADMVMVKPGMPYLDVIARVKDSVSTPLFAYHVSGEFAMLKAASEKGWLDYDTCLTETLIGFKRAGCSGILTYGAIDMAKLLKNA